MTEKLSAYGYSLSLATLSRLLSDMSRPFCDLIILLCFSLGDDSLIAPYGSILRSATPAHVEAVQGRRVVESPVNPILT